MATKRSERGGEGTPVHVYASVCWTSTTTVKPQRCVAGTVQRLEEVQIDHGKELAFSHPACVRFFAGRGSGHACDRNQFR